MDQHFYRNFLIPVDQFNKVELEYKLMYHRGLRPEKIMGIKFSFGIQKYEIKWKNKVETDLLDVEVVKILFPSLIQNYYKEKFYKTYGKPSRYFDTE